MSVLTAQISKNGIERVFASVTSVAGGALAAEVFEAAGLGLRLTHDAVREHFDRNSLVDNVIPLPEGETEVFACLCGERLLSADAAIKHVEKDHCSGRVRRDLSKVESLIEGMILPNPLPPAPEPTFVVQDRPFAEELQTELTGVFSDIGGGEGNPATRAKNLIEFCRWDQVTALNFLEYKVKLIDGEPDSEKKIPAQFHEDYLTAIALFLRQVGKLSKLYGRTKAK